MAATKDSKKLLIRCLTQEIPVFVLTGSDKCAMAALNAYLAVFPNLSRIWKPMSFPILMIFRNRNQRK